MKTNDECCFMCNATETCGIYLIVPNELGGRDIQQNMVPLCRECHQQVINGFNNLEKIIFSGDDSSPDESNSKLQIKLLCLSLIRLIALWSKRPDEAHEECKKIVAFWSSPEKHLIKRDFGDFVAEFSECENMRTRSQSSGEISAHDISTKVRELMKKGVTNNSILSALEDIDKQGPRNAGVRKQPRYSPNQLDAFDPADKDLIDF